MGQEILQPIMRKGVLSATSMIVRRGAGFIYVRPVMDTCLCQEELLWIRRVISILPLQLAHLTVQVAIPAPIVQVITLVRNITTSMTMYCVHPTVLRIMKVEEVPTLSMW